MALRDKLGDLSQKIAAEKRSVEEIKQNEELRPVRANIKKLEKERLDLEMIKNSLDFKNAQDPKNNQGMKEYAEDIAVGVKKTRGQLEEIAAENAVALEKLGIQNPDELANNPEFAEEEEVVAYKEAKNKEEDLRLSDTKLKNRLAKLGIEMNDENFSYEAASKEIGQRLENLEKELTAEKLKTPEGRTEVVDNLAEEFSKNTKNIFWSGIAMIDKEAQRRGGREVSENSYHEFNLSEKRDYRGDHFRVEFVDDNKSKIDNYHSLPILPKNFSEQVDEYGLEVAEAALKESYSKKVDEAFMEPNGPLGKSLKMRETLEAVSSGKRQRAEEYLTSFENKKRELLNLLELKSKELDAKGIKFNPTSPPNYGISYEEIFVLGRKSDAQQITDDLRENKKLLPKYDFDKIVATTEKHIADIDRAIEVVKNIKDQEGVDRFFYDSKSPDYISSFHKKSLSFDLENILYKNPKEVSYQEMSTLASRAGNFEEAVQYLNQEIAEAEEARRRTSEKIGELVDYNVMLYKLSAKNKSRYSLEDPGFANLNKLDYNLGNLGNYIKDIKREREEASGMISEIAGLKSKVNPEDRVNVNGLTIDVEEKTKEYKRIFEDINKKEEEIKDKKFDLQKEKNSEPWLGKDKWRARVSNLEDDVKRLEQEKSNLQDSYNENLKESYFYVNKEKMSWHGQTKKLIENYRVSGKAGEVFDELEKKLIALVDKKVPEEAQRDFDKLTSLEAGLRGEK